MGLVTDENGLLTSNDEVSTLVQGWLQFAEVISLTLNKILISNALNDLIKVNLTHSQGIYRRQGSKLYINSYLT